MDRTFNGGKRTGLIALAVLLIVGVFTSLLYYTFSVIEDDAQDIIDQHNKTENRTAQISVVKAQEFIAIREATVKEKERAAKIEEEVISTGGLEPLTELKFNPSQDALSVELNKQTYAIAEKTLAYYTEMSQFLDPLMMLAQSATEFGGNQDGKVLWVPSLPTAKLDRQYWTVDMINGFNSAKLLELVPSLGRYQDSFWGPLQLEVSYGVNPDSDKFDGTRFNYDDENLNISANPIALNVYNSGNKSSKRVKGSLRLGDRWNWHDATLSAWARWDYGYRVLRSERKANLTSQLSKVVYVGLNHNVGQSVSHEEDSGSVNWVSGAKQKDLWEFIYTFNDPQAQAYIKGLADKRIQAYRSDGSNPMVHATENEVYEYVNNFSDNRLQNRIISDVRTKSGKGWEVTAHAVKIAVHYSVLNQLYGGA